MSMRVIEDNFLFGFLVLHNNNKKFSLLTCFKSTLSLLFYQQYSFFLLHMSVRLLSWNVRVVDQKIQQFLICS